MENQVDFSTFKGLLQALENSDTSIRLRMSGEGWMDFSKLILLSESAMIVQDGVARRVMNLHSVVEFEIDKHTLDFSPHNEYEVTY